ncbi:MAG: NAD(P)-dependent oxidoreductase [Verrucomicrobiae bacterium]|nr:NAD(P)-dependent oxidoreductase [Verrucomicrobiae bacterium]MCP5541051.1 NAD(P)-dependent oxidoreductase [Akkermansiaceae bacterium]
MSRPDAGVLGTVGDRSGDFAVLGANGKMGFHLCRMLRRAIEATDGPDSERRVVAVSRFGSEGARARFEEHGIVAIPADLGVPDQLSRLPAFPNVFFLAGVKFGTAHDPDLLRRMNVEMPARVAERFRDSRLVALSTGCVYSFTTPASGGSTEESDTVPVGDYAISCLGREAAFRDAADRHGTRSALIRLNYAIDLRYGVLLDIAQKVAAGLPVDVTMGHVNVVWQSDALSHTIQALPLADAPPFVLNVTGPGILRVRELAEKFGGHFGKEPVITGAEAESAWLNDASKAHRLFGPPAVGIDDMIAWVAEWVKAGGETLGKPTRFEARDGNY